RLRPGRRDAGVLSGQQAPDGDAPGASQAVRRKQGSRRRPPSSRASRARLRRPPLEGARAGQAGRGRGEGGGGVREGHPPGGYARTATPALHTWPLDTTSLPDALRATRAAGWDGVELRRIDFARAAEKGQPAADVLKLVKASGLGVACVGVEMGWMFADGAEL